MTMTIDHHSDRHLGGMSFDHIPYPTGPQFSNPWSSSTPSSQLYQPMNQNPMGFDAIKASRTAAATLPYSSVSASASLPATNYSNVAYGQSSDLVNMSQDLLNSAQQGFPTAQSSNSYVSSSLPPFTNAYSTSTQLPRRLSQSSNVSSSAASQASYSDALDASRGMVALAGQDMTTPRNLYDTRSDRGSTSGYGFPMSHSSQSSISGGSYTGSYESYAGSVGSVGDSHSDYGSQSDMESVNSRTLPPPSGLIATNGLPPPQSMMGQFNSKVSSSTQKKHKCKICDKRFTRPSSLQTHMYSHTGEKPYACDAPNCGRHFSVVSNLRRHRKVHRGEHASDHGSPEGSWISDK